MREMDIYEIVDEYVNCDSLWNDWNDENTQLKLRKILRDHLTTSERYTILLYAELQSMRELGKHLKVSTSTAFNEIKRIREKIKEYL